MNPLYLSAILGFLVGLAAGILLLLSLRPRWKARGYALGYDAACQSQQRLLDSCYTRIAALNNDVAQHQQLREIEKRGHQTAVEAIMQDADERIALYARRSNPLNAQDLEDLEALSTLLDLAAATFAGVRANDKATLTRNLQQRLINMTQRLHAQPGLHATEPSAEEAHA